MEGLLPHFWKARLCSSCANFLPIFHENFEEEKTVKFSIGFFKDFLVELENPCFFVENKWKYEQN